MSPINRRSLLAATAAVAGTGSLFHKPALAHSHGTGVHSLLSNSGQGPGASGVLMIETANRFLASLDPQQRAKATFQFGDDERLNWHFIPKERKGLPFREMS